MESNYPSHEIFWIGASGGCELESKLQGTTSPSGPGRPPAVCGELEDPHLSIGAGSDISDTIAAHARAGTYTCCHLPVTTVPRWALVSNELDFDHLFLTIAGSVYTIVPDLDSEWPLQVGVLAASVLDLRGVSQSSVAVSGCHCQCGTNWLIMFLGSTLTDSDMPVPLSCI